MSSILANGATPIPNVKLRVMEWAPGRFVTDLATSAECDEARAAITDAILSIEGQLDAHGCEVQQGKPETRPEWKRRAMGALRAKIATRAEVIMRRARLVKEEERERDVGRDRSILKIIREIDPVLFQRGLDIAQRRGLV